LKGWQLIISFTVAAAGLGSVVLAGISSVERRSGIVAAQFGFARTTEVSESFSDLKQWQLYSDIRRLKRSIFDLGPPTTDRDRERFDDLSSQLITVQAEYDRISKKRAR
jgi:outer membrane murein-binding lipoprotein Lpp